MRLAAGRCAPQYRLTTARSAPPNDRRHHAVLSANIDSVRVAARTGCGSVADSARPAGFRMWRKSFLHLCQRTITQRVTSITSTTPTARRRRRGILGYQRHSRCPIQEDETGPRRVGRCGGLLSAIGGHRIHPPNVGRYRAEAGDFMCKYRDPAHGLPLPSYDLGKSAGACTAFTRRDVIRRS
jgi:hypothetical protein